MSRVARGFGSFLLHLRESNRLTSIKEQKSVTKMGHQGTSVENLATAFVKKESKGQAEGDRKLCSGQHEICYSMNQKFNLILAGYRLTGTIISRVYCD